ncbi:MAG: hypothetical protein SNJ78_06800, partial [Spirochaetales bacterium]
TQGKVRIEGGTIHSIRTRAESLFRIQEGSFQALRSRFSFERTETNTTLFHIRNKASVLFESSELKPGSGEATMSLEARDSTLTLKNTVFHSGEGSLSAQAIRVQRGSIQLIQSEIHGSSKAYIAVGASFWNTRGEITATTFRMAARYGAQAFQIRSSEVVLRGSLIESERTEDYLYYATLEDSSLQMVGTVFRKGDSADFTAFHLLNSKLEGEKNTLELGRGTRNSSGFVLAGKSDLLLRANEILYPDSKGILFVLSERDTVKVEIRENRFKVEGAYREVRQGGRRVLIRSLKDLENTTTPQVRIEANRTS